MITQGPDLFTIVPQAAVSAEGHTGERTAVGAVSNLSVLLQLSNLASGELDLIIVQDLISNYHYNKKYELVDTIFNGMEKLIKV